ncbi:DUF4124 domain-containing protein [Undibacterium piscinae]|uniref:DUF4124 domain-containing protein n=1 Tax=Undibacterium piscinae TaxID=2495591 RepID=A0A6M4A1G8_9BURK|nr:DUF4124 domain-containing protein [Undibacterium piscinae]
MITATCQAQYVWLDEKGNKQFSDMPPPVSVPAQKILKAPQKNNGSSTSATKTSTEQTKNEASNINEQLKKPATTASKNEEFNKRKIEQEEKDKKKAAEDQLSADKAQNCERARAYQKTIESGQRDYHDQPERRTRLHKRRPASTGTGRSSARVKGLQIEARRNR